MTERETPTAADAFKAYDIEYADRIKVSSEENNLCANVTCVLYIFWIDPRGK